MNATSERTETYGYDPQLDYLTSANYGDGNPNATPSWSYDAAGNRSDAVVDNLNRVTSLGGVSTTSDILGNRLTLGSSNYVWDPLNRLLGIVGVDAFQYRADGMRVQHALTTPPSGASATKLTQYRYDGQMPIEDVEHDVASGGTTLTRYGLGARGVDLIERTDPQGNVVTGFPLYDAHGNNVATLTRSGTSYSIGDRRTYDAWGTVRSQQSAGDPTLRYCAKLGHKQDDESGLIYMRARYYDPTSGRFASEDPENHGWNHCTYCTNDPVNRSDETGKADDGIDLGAGEKFASILDKLFGWVPDKQLHALLKQIALVTETATFVSGLLAGFTAVLACAAAMTAVCPLVLGVLMGAYLVASMAMMMALIVNCGSESADNYQDWEEGGKQGSGGTTTAPPSGPMA